MFKRFSTIIALILLTQFSISASYLLTIHRSDGDDEVIKLENKPVASFTSSDLVINADGTEISVPRHKIGGIEISDDPTTSIDNEKIGSIVEVVDAETYRFNIADSSHVRVYDLMGRMVQSAEIVSDGEYTTVSLSSCATGIYIIAYNNKSIKVTKR